MIVHKFGGTSVGNAARFATVADILINQYQRGTAPVAVISAMSGVTNQLIAGARAAAEGRDGIYREIKAELLRRHCATVEALLPPGTARLDTAGFVEDRLHELERLYRSIAVLGEVTARGRDAVASFGEQLSVAILAATLRARGFRAQAFNTTELVITNDQFGEAAPQMEATRDRLQQQVRPFVENGGIPVITGYIGATAQGVTTTLGRGGSDYSAAIIGAGLDAAEVWIWTDVDGILTADPNLVPQAQTLLEISYAEAADLAYYGASVLHPKTIRPVVERGIPLRILNSFNPQHPGTLVTGTPAAARRRKPALITTTGLSLMALGTRDDSWKLTLAAQALQTLSAEGIEVQMFSQSFSEHSMNLIVKEQDLAASLKALRRVFPDEQRYSLETKEEVATLSVVGVPDWNQRGIIPHTFAALGALGARVIAVAQAATEHNVSFCIPKDQVAHTVQYLHRELGLEEENHG